MSASLQSAMAAAQASAKAAHAASAAASVHILPPSFQGHRAFCLSSGEQRLAPQHQYQQQLQRQPSDSQQQQQLEAFLPVLSE